jgi:hypothetical protein
MYKTNDTLNDALIKGYDLDFGIVFEKAFENYKKIALLAGVTIILLVILFLALVGTIIGSLVGINSLTESLTDFSIFNFGIEYVLLYVGIMVLFSALLSPIGAGFLKMAHLAENNQDFSIGTVFDYFKTAYFKELFFSTLIVSIVNLGISTLLEYFAIPILGSIISYVIAFFTIFMVPLIIFCNLNAIEAIQSSAKLALKQPLIIIGLAIIGFFAIMIGLIGFCIGIFFTLPFWYSLNYTIYNQAVPIDKTSEIEEIGSFLE